MDIGHIHVGVRDLPSALGWFEKVLQWKPTYRDEGMAVLSSKPVQVILDVAKTDAPITIAFATRDVDANYERLRSRGALSLRGPKDQPYGVRSAYFKGPGAIKFELEGPLRSAKKKASK